MFEYQGSGTAGGDPGQAPAATVPAAAPAGTGIQAVATSTVAFVGRTRKGPVNEPVIIEGFAQFQQQFGGLWAESLLPHAVEQFFEHGGRHAIVVRVASKARAPSIDLPAGDGRLTLVGLSPGTHEYLRASVDYDGIGNQDTDLFNLVVQRVRARGSELVESQEIYRRVSVLSGSARDVAGKLASSQLVRVEGPLPQERPGITMGSEPGSLIGYVECNGDGEDGERLSDYDLIGSEARHSGLFALQAGPAFNFLYLPPPAREQDIGMSALVVGARFCRQHHALLLVDPPHNWKDMPAAMAGLADWPFHSADAVMFYPWLRSHDRLQDRTAQFPPSAAAVAALLRGAADNGISSEAAGPALRPVSVPTIWIDRDQGLRLAHQGVNALRASRVPSRSATPPCTLAGELGKGIEARLLSARRLALQISASIERGTRWVSIEGNTPRSRERVCRQVEEFLARLANDGLLAGQERNRHYFVICDDRLNTPLQQAQGLFQLVFGYQPARSPNLLSWLVEHRPGGSRTRPVSVNQLVAFAPGVG